MSEIALARCQTALPGWRGRGLDDFDIDAPKGFSSITMGIRARAELDPPAVLYRQLEGKDNAILDHEAERAVFELLGEVDIAARCLHYERDFRLEAFFQGRTLTADEVFDPAIQAGVTAELHRFHQLTPPGLPRATFFELLHRKWRPLAEHVLGPARGSFAPAEQAMCQELASITSEETHRKVLACLPDEAPVFCHNDTYHGNVFIEDSGRIRLLDFEFSCYNHPAFDLANFFAETVMVHGLEDPPHFAVGDPRFTDDDVAQLTGLYLDREMGLTDAARRRRHEELTAATRRALLLSDYMYAMAALPLALEPIQKIQFIPYAHTRYQRFLARWSDEFGAP